VKPLGACSSSKVSSPRPTAALLQPQLPCTLRLLSPPYTLLRQSCTGKRGREKKLCRFGRGGESGRRTAGPLTVSWYAEGAAAASSRPTMRKGRRASGAVRRWSRDGTRQAPHREERVRVAGAIASAEEERPADAAQALRTKRAVGAARVRMAGPASSRRSERRSGRRAAHAEPRRWAAEVRAPPARRFARRSEVKVRGPLLTFLNATSKE
jgi:hypothetical protein